jgi:hypothetical protein
VGRCRRHFGSLAGATGDGPAGAPRPPWPAPEELPDPAQSGARRAGDEPAAHRPPQRLGGGALRVEFFPTSASASSPGHWSPNARSTCARRTSTGPGITRATTRSRRASTPSGAPATCSFSRRCERMPSDPSRQGDLMAGGRLEVRIRRAGSRSFLTVTNGTGGVRLEQEIEIEIDAGRFDGLWPLTSGARIEKTRRLLYVSSRTTIWWRLTSTPATSRAHQGLRHVPAPMPLRSGSVRPGGSARDHQRCSPPQPAPGGRRLLGRVASRGGYDWAER